jgi:hypothetical protein
MLGVVHELLESHALMPMEWLDGWQKHDVRNQIALARGDLENLDLKLYVSL